MEQERELPAEGDGPTSETPHDGDQASWFFDPPGGAYERQEASQKELRDNVEQVYQEQTSRRRDVFRSVDAEILPEPEKKGLFGRKKKQPVERDRNTWQSPGGTWTLNRDMAAQADEPQPPATAPQPNAMRQRVQEVAEPTPPPAPFVPSAPQPTHEADDDWSTEALSDFAAPAAATAPEAPAPAEPKRTRWDEMFGGGPATEDTSIAEGMKALWGNGEGSKKRRLDDPAGESITAGETGWDDVAPAAETISPDEDTDWHDVAPVAAAAHLEPLDEQPAPQPVYQADPEPEPQAAAPIASEDEPKTSKWDEAFSQPAGEDTIEAMRKWSTAAAATSATRRVLADTPATSDEPTAAVDDGDEAPAGYVYREVEDVAIVVEQPKKRGFFGRLFGRSKEDDLAMDYVARPTGDWLPPVDDDDDADADENEADQTPAAFEAAAEAVPQVEDEDDFDTPTASPFQTSTRWTDELREAEEGSVAPAAAEQPVADPAATREEELQARARAAMLAADLFYASEDEPAPPAPQGIFAATSDDKSHWDDEDDAWGPSTVIGEEPADRRVAHLAEPEDDAWSPEAEPVAPAVAAAAAFVPDPLDDAWKPAGEDTRTPPPIEDFYAHLESTLDEPVVAPVATAAIHFQGNAGGVFDESSQETPATEVDFFESAPVKDVETPVSAFVAPAVESEESPAAEWHFAFDDEEPSAPAGDVPAPFAGVDPAPPAEVDDDPWAAFAAAREASVADDEEEPPTGPPSLAPFAAAAVVGAAAIDNIENNDDEPDWSAAFAEDDESPIEEQPAAAELVTEMEAPAEDDPWGSVAAVAEEGASDAAFAPISPFSEATGEDTDASAPAAAASGYDNVLGIIDDAYETPADEDGTSVLLRTPGASRKPLSERYQDPLLATTADHGQRPPSDDESDVPDLGGWTLPASAGMAHEDEMDVVLRAFEAHAASDGDDAPVDPFPHIARTSAEHEASSFDGIEELLGDGLDELDDDDEPLVPVSGGSMGLKGWAPQRGAGAVPTATVSAAAWESQAIAAGFDPNAPAEGAAPWPSDQPDEAPPPPWGGDIAAASGDESRTNKTRVLIREIVETGLLALLVFLAVRGSFQNFRVEGQSMEPTLNDGEFLIVNKLVFSEVDMDKLGTFVPFVDAGEDGMRHVFHGPERGDVIVFHDPRNPDEDLIKRVIGLPGDTVEIRDGVVFINGMELDEPYIEQVWDGSKEAQVIPEGEYFVLGDNRSNSLDSRSDQIGFVHEDLIIGKAALAYWPPSKFASTLSENPTCSPDPDCRPDDFAAGEQMASPLPANE